MVVKSSEPIFNVPPATLAVVTLNIIIFIWQIVTHDSATGDWAFHPRALLYHAHYLHPWLTLITYQFLHGSWLHLGINMLALMAFGSAAERLLGAMRYISLYLVCGAGAALVNLPWADQVPAIIGASGAIAGLTGFVLMRTQRRGRVQMIAVMIASMWLFGVIGLAGVHQPIAWGTHIGGFLSGVIAALGHFGGVKSR